MESLGAARISRTPCTALLLAILGLAALGPVFVMTRAECAPVGEPGVPPKVVPRRPTWPEGFREAAKQTFRTDEIEIGPDQKGGWRDFSVRGDLTPRSMAGKRFDSPREHARAVATAFIDENRHLFVGDDLESIDIRDGEAAPSIGIPSKYRVMFHVYVHGLPFEGATIDFLVSESGVIHKVYGSLAPATAEMEKGVQRALREGLKEEEILDIAREDLRRTGNAEPEDVRVLKHYASPTPPYVFWFVEGWASTYRCSYAIDAVAGRVTVRSCYEP